MTKTDMLSTAIAFAAAQHSMQIDKSGKPYILHPLKVMYLLKTEDMELQCIAVLHDVIEDTDATYDDLRAMEMSDRVIAGVKQLTKLPGTTEEEYQTQVMSSRDACLVKMQDLRHNSDLRRLKGVEIQDFKRAQKYMAFYDRLKKHLEGVQ